ncbi:SH3-like domain-containing protein [Nocardia asteroides]|uniref:SH3-like domain-containing protein n=1 Tax=Nocardia asteroides TaxID=1824 RepID=UPI00341C4A39
MSRSLFTPGDGYAPPPDLLDHARLWAYLKTDHDVGGEPDAAITNQNKQYEVWEPNTYVICEVLAWRGIWLSEERRRIGNVDLGRTLYPGLPYYGALRRWPGRETTDGDVTALAYESPAPEDETWDRRDAKPEWFYVVEFDMARLWHGYTGTAGDVLRTEIPERWLEAVTT